MAERLLPFMRRPAENLFQIEQHVRLLENINSLTYLVEDNLADLSVLGRVYANDAELQDFGNSIIDIGCKASAFYKDLCAREASISNANTDLLYARKAVHEGMEYRRQLLLASSRFRVNLSCMGFNMEVYPCLPASIVEVKGHHAQNLTMMEKPRETRLLTAKTTPSQAEPLSGWKMKGSLMMGIHLCLPRITRSSMT